MLRNSYLKSTLQTLSFETFLKISMKNNLRKTQVIFYSRILLVTQILWTFLYPELLNLLYISSEKNQGFLGKKIYIICNEKSMGTPFTQTGELKRNWNSHHFVRVDPIGDFL